MNVAQITMDIQLPPHLPSRPVFVVPNSNRPSEKPARPQIRYWLKRLWELSSKRQFSWSTFIRAAPFVNPSAKALFLPLLPLFCAQSPKVVFALSLLQPGGSDFPVFVPFYCGFIFRQL